MERIAAEFLTFMRRGVKTLLNWLPAHLVSRSSAPHGELQITGRLELGQKKSLLMVSCSGRKFLVASGAENITAMVEIRPNEGWTKSAPRLDRKYLRKRRARTLVGAGRW